MWAISVALAQNYVDSLRDNVKRSIGQKLRGGEWISQAPVGYLHVKDARGKPDIVIDPLRAPLVRQLFEKYATGNYTLSMLVKMAKERGLRTFLSDRRLMHIIWRKRSVSNRVRQ